MKLKDYVKVDTKESSIKLKFPNDYFKIKLEDGKWKEQLYVYLYGRKTCIECGSKVNFKSWKIGFNKFCSYRCVNSNKFTLDLMKKNRSKTNLEKRGVKFIGSSKEVIEKREKTNLKKYGFKSCLSSKEVIEKREKTNLKKYGFKNSSKNLLIKEKIRNSNQHLSEKSSVEKRIEKRLNTLTENIISHKEINHISENGEILYGKCENNHEFTISRKNFHYRNYNNLSMCNICNSGNSYIENEIELFLKNSNIKYQKRDRKLIKPYEIDFLISNKLAIEVNGMYWHSSYFKDKTYHQEKAKMIHDKNIPFLTIWEDQWNNKKNIIKSMINNFLGYSTKIYARKCEIKEITAKESKSFLNQNHLQGNINSKIKLGLFYENSLVSVMTFGSLRKTLNSKGSKTQFELLRFANKLNHTVIGGASKLLKYFEKKYKPTEITSYALYERSNGKLYNTLGFECLKLTHPGYFYFKNGLRYHRYKFRKSELIKEGYDFNKTEEEIMSERGYLKCYDSGNLKFVKKY